MHRVHRVHGTPDANLNPRDFKAGACRNAAVSGAVDVHRAEKCGFLRGTAKCGHHRWLHTVHEGVWPSRAARASVCVQGAPPKCAGQWGPCHLQLPILPKDVSTHQEQQQGKPWAAGIGRHHQQFRQRITKVAVHLPFLWWMGCHLLCLAGCFVIDAVDRLACWRCTQRPSHS